ncbi:unnamed protein product [Brugia pahangi]|uniref:Secreted protein n=1 Tax=Brugia pahangi TaxID=6280 RepID=A0A0N4TR03_BRUPA|nr:unnamed protein product [Brugia pahangi]
MKSIIHFWGQIVVALRLQIYALLYQYLEAVSQTLCLLILVVQAALSLMHFHSVLQIIKLSSNQCKFTTIINNYY